MTVPLDVPELSGSVVRLEKLAVRHAADLAEAAAGEREAFGFTWVPHGEAAVLDYVRTQLGRVGMIPFAQVSTGTGRAVGSTSLFNFRALPGRAGPFAVEIGFTWVAGAAQRTGVNVEAKLLLLTYAFEQLGVERVEFKTDARNERSRRALAGLGAQFEGVLRRFSQSWAPGEDGLLRDSAMYSVTAAEWPACREHLRGRLGRCDDSYRDGEGARQKPALAQARSRSASPKASAGPTAPGGRTPSAAARAAAQASIGAVNE
jgi:RimJ/RimL family protein N-acetyltransferase